MLGLFLKRRGNAALSLAVLFLVGILLLLGVFLFFYEVKAPSDKSQSSIKVMQQDGSSRVEVPQKNILVYIDINTEMFSVDTGLYSNGILIQTLDLGTAKVINTGPSEKDFKETVREWIIRSNEVSETVESEKEVSKTPNGDFYILTIETNDIYGSLFHLYIKYLDSNDILHISSESYDLITKFIY